MAEKNENETKNSFENQMKENNNSSNVDCCMEKLILDDDQVTSPNSDKSFQSSIRYFFYLLTFFDYFYQKHLIVFYSISFKKLFNLKRKTIFSDTIRNFPK